MPDTCARKKSIATLSVFSNTLLVLLKIIVGLLSGSVSILSEAIHSAIDLLAAIIALYAVATSSKPADDKHPYGHGKVENISGVIEAALIFLAAGWIIYEAVLKFFKPHEIEKIGLGFVVMLFSAAMNQFVSHKLFRVAAETDSIALKADAWHLRTDVYTSLGVMAGLGLILAGHQFFPGVNLLWLDPLIAICVALLILHAAWELTVRSGRDLLDERLPPEEEDWITAYLNSLQQNKIARYHHLRSRKSGSFRFIEFHLLVDPALSVRDSHRLNDEVVGKIKEQYPDSRVTIHFEPDDRNNAGSK